LAKRDFYQKNPCSQESMVWDNQNHKGTMEHSKNLGRSTMSVLLTKTKLLNKITELMEPRNEK
jgi:hypothetical protein